MEKRKNLDCNTARTKSKIMPENYKTEEFLKKLTPCIERGELEKCVEEAARVAGEMGASICLPFSDKTVLFIAEKQ